VERLQQQTAKANGKWTEILERITATVQSLAQHNLYLPGHCESLVGDFNRGNFVVLLKYLKKFGPVMKKHLKSVSGKPGCPPFKMN
jgi:hypothetical protein